MYSTEIEGQVWEFGTSGLLFRSNKLMYDRGTKSLWHQFTGEPVVGALVGSGIELELLPIVLTTWGDWLAAHPDTTVLPELFEIGTTGPVAPPVGAGATGLVRSGSAGPSAETRSPILAPS